METTTKQIPLRISEPLFQAVKNLAKQKGVSMNQFVQESLERTIQENLAQQMKAAYELLGQDLDESTVEPFLKAQSEAVD